MHRNSPKRIYIANAIYFVTFNTYQRYPFFDLNRIYGKELCSLFVKQIKVAKEIHKFKLYAFVIITDHIHLLIQPHQESNISKCMFSIKKNFAHNVNKLYFDDFHFKWHRSYYDHYIRSEYDLRNHIFYIANNPKKHDAVEALNYEFVYPNRSNYNYEGMIDYIRY